MLLQVRLGLRPLDRLRDAVAAIRAGRRERLPEAQPFEVRPLVIEINALLDQNAATLERARSHVANLAHGLKTPLATLALGLAEGERDKTGVLRDLIDQIERRIRHHLGRARSAALNGPVRMRVPIARIGDLVETLAKIYAARTIAVTQELPQDLAVACEPQDFDEMIGNLLDNAFKWSRGRIAIRATFEANRDIAIAIADDGNGLDAAQLPQLLRPGMRADEEAPGFGFGLSITRELAELYGGTLDFATPSWGGLEVTLRLPCAP
jgi:signal transduction histidine kinase